jgi:hypothetical protein
MFLEQRLCLLALFIKFQQNERIVYVELILKSD